MNRDQRQKLIGVMGASRCNARVYREAYEVGRLIAAKGATLLCGGGGGVMEAAAKGAKDEGGLTLGILPGSNQQESPANPFIDIAIFTGLSDARNAINVRSADVVIALWGGFGTLSEIALALKIGTPVVLLHTWRFEIDSPPPLTCAALARSPQEAVQRAFELLQASD